MRRTPRNRPYALVIAHEDGTIHLRTATLYYGAFGAALHEAGLAWFVDYAVNESDQPFPCGMQVRVGDEYADGHAGYVARTLELAGLWAFGYEPFYERRTDGPFVRYRRSAGVAPRQPLKLLFNTDYGFDDGSWYFGDPTSLGEVVAQASALGLPLCEVRSATGELESVALDAHRGGWRRVNDALRRRKVWVHEEEFRPIGYRDHEE